MASGNEPTLETAVVAATAARLYGCCCLLNSYLDAADVRNLCCARFLLARMHSAPLVER
jgi:hypothetical protein